MPNDDYMPVSELAVHLGVVIGALSRPGAEEQLVLMLRQSDAGGFSLPAVASLHARLGRVLDAVAKQGE